MASVIRQVAPASALCLASSAHASPHCKAEQQSVKIRSESQLGGLSTKHSHVSTSQERSQACSDSKAAALSRRGALGALFLGLVTLSGREAQADEGRSKEAEQAAQVQEDSGRVAERRAAQNDIQKDVVWSAKIPQISKKSKEAKQAAQVQEDSAQVAERRKQSSSKPAETLTEEPVFFQQYPVGQKSKEAFQSDQVKQDSGKVAERREKRKEAISKPVVFGL